MSYFSLVFKYLPYSSVVDLQCCVNFCYIAKDSVIHTYIHTYIYILWVAFRYINDTLLSLGGVHF